MYRCKCCLAGLLAVSSLPTLWLVKSLPLFARRDPGIVLMAAAACQVLVLLSHFPTCSRAFLLFLFCVMKTSNSQAKLGGWVLTDKSGFLTSTEGASMSGAAGTVLFLFPWNPSGGRCFHPWQCSALPVSGTRTVLHTSTSEWPQGVPGRCVLGASSFSAGTVWAQPAGLRAGSAALGPGVVPVCAYTILALQDFYSNYCVSCWTLCSIILETRP